MADLYKVTLCRCDCECELSSADVDQHNITVYTIKTPKYCAGLQQDKFGIVPHRLAASVCTSYNNNNNNNGE